MFPTVADIAGIPLTDVEAGSAVVLPDGTQRLLDGRTLLPLLADPTASHHDLLYAEDFRPNGPGPYTTDQRTLRDDRFKLVRKGTVDSLYEIVPGAIDEGQDLLALGATDEQQAAYERLAAELDARSVDLVFEGF